MSYVAPRLQHALAATCAACIACSTPQHPPTAAPVAAEQSPTVGPAAPPAAAEESPPDAARIATTLKLAVTHLEPEPELTPNEATHDDAGRLLGARFLDDTAGCVGLPTKVKAVYKPSVAPPNELDGDLLYAPGLTLDDLTACYVGLGGHRSAIASPVPDVRGFPGLSLDRSVYVDLGHGWLFAAGDVDKAVEQLARIRTP